MLFFPRIGAASLFLLLPLLTLLPCCLSLVVVDTDMGDDDVAAIATLLLHGVELHAVTAANGLASTQAGAVSALRLLDYLNKSQPHLDLTSVPVFVGLPHPLKGNNSFGADVRKDSDELPNRYGWPNTTRVPCTTSASDFLVDLVRKHPDDVTIISLAPLTNVALAVEADPSFAMMLKTLIIMGGGVYIDSNDTPNNASEWNFYVDPYAAATVLSSGITPIVMNGLDVTQYSVVTPEFVANMSEGCSETVPAEECIIKIAAKTILNWSWEIHEFYDTVAAAYYIEPTLFHTKSLNLRVIESGSQQGRSIIDNTTGHPVDVSVALNSTAFFQLLQAGL